MEVSTIFLLPLDQSDRMKGKEKRDQRSSKRAIHCSLYNQVEYATYTIPRNVAPPGYLAIGKEDRPEIKDQVHIQSQSMEWMHTVYQHWREEEKERMGREGDRVVDNRDKLKWDSAQFKIDLWSLSDAWESTRVSGWKGWGTEGRKSEQE